MEEQKPAEENLFEKIKAYVQVRVRLAVLNSIEKTAEIYASLISKLIVSLFLLMALLFGSIALAFYLAEIYQSNWCGFLCVGGLYLLIGIFILLIRRKSIEKPLMDQFVKKVLASKNEEDGK
jgi:hypothetical protein